MSKLAKRVDDHVGERIRERRVMMGLTQEHLAQALEISYQQVQKYETGANRVSAGRLFEIGARLEVDVAYFYDGFYPETKSAALEHGGKNRSVIELVRNYSDIKEPSVRSSVSGLVKSLARK